MITFNKANSSGRKGKEGPANQSWNFKQSMGARNRVRIGLSYQPARLHRLAEFIPWNRFLGSVNKCFFLDCTKLRRKEEANTIFMRHRRLSSYLGEKRYIIFYKFGTKLKLSVITHCFF
jgi:hypothetical protein